MKLKTVVLASAMAMTAALPLSANAIEKGEKSFGIFGMFQSSDSFDMTMVQVNLGMFVTDNIEANGNVMVIDAGGDTITALGASADYYIATKAAVLPYVGAGVFSMDMPGGSYAELIAEAGLRQPLSETADIDYKIQLHEPLDDAYESMTVGLVGLRVKF